MPPRMDIRLRPTREQDRSFLWDLHRTTLGPYVAATFGWDGGEQRARFDAKFEPGRGEVIEFAGRRVGYLQVVRAEDPVWLQQIEIAPEYQGRGVGSAVIDGLGRAVRLRVLLSNPRARALYERLGFRETTRTGTHVYMER
jgi:ribosomal protein S18 acetylase RimI-like enzyme